MRNVPAKGGEFEGMCAFRFGAWEANHPFMLEQESCVGYVLPPGMAQLALQNEWVGPWLGISFPMAQDFREALGQFTR